MSSPSSSTSTTPLMCVLKRVGSETFFLKCHSDLTQDEAHLLETQIVGFHQGSRSPNFWVKSVPEQLNSLAQEIQEFSESSDEHEKSFGEELIRVLIKNEHRMSSAKQVLKKMVPMIILKAARDASEELGLYYEHNTLAIPSLTDEITAMPGFPDNLELVIETCGVLVASYRNFCNQRDHELWLADSDFDDY